MPIYEYACADGHRFEKRQGFDADPVMTCPTCDAPSERVIHVPAVHYKGSGFYTTDYGRSGSYQSDSKADTGDTGDTGSSEKKSSPQPGSKTKPTSSTKPESSTTATKDAD